MHSAENEINQLKTQIATLSEQHEKDVQENDKVTALNHALQESLGDLSAELLKFKQNLVLTEMKTELRKKNELVMEYEEKIEKIEERLRKLMGSTRCEKGLEWELKQIEDKLDTFQKENAELAMRHEKEKGQFVQERIESKKALDILEKSVQHLHAEREELEKKARAKIERALKKYAHIAVQTESLTEEPNKEPVSKYKSEIARMLEHESLLCKELASLREKCSVLTLRSEDTARILSSKDEQLARVENAMNRLMGENIDLRKRREIAMLELNKLAQRARRNKDEKSRCKTLDEVGKSSSETVFKNGIWVIVHMFRRRRPRA